MAQQLKNIPLSNDTVQRWIPDISEDLNEQLMDNFETINCALQVDEATDIYRESHLIAYIWFLDADKVVKELLFLPYFLNTCNEWDNWRLFQRKRTNMGKMGLNLH